MAAPTSAGPPRLGMMSPLELDEHPTHDGRDHLIAFGALAAYCVLALLLIR